ncbi:MAG: hypothetical protein HQL58_08965 [Magnetococcales bacterium]|nr:hypothetical protein [Magnetococcales bacterium]
MVKGLEVWLTAALMLSAAVVHAADQDNWRRGLSDPSRPPSAALLNPVAEISAEASVAPAPSSERWRLKMVRLTDGAGLAVINDRIVRPGQSVDGFLVENIHRRGVSGMATNQKLELVMDMDRATTGLVVRHSTKRTGPTP